MEIRKIAEWGRWERERCWQPKPAFGPSFSPCCASQKGVTVWATPALQQIDVQVLTCILSLGRGIWKRTLKILDGQNIPQKKKNTPRHQVILWCKEILKNTLIDICPKYHRALSRCSAVYKLRSFRNQCTPFKTSVLLFIKQTHFLLPYSGTFPAKIRTSIYQTHLTYAINWLYMVQT